MMGLEHMSLRPNLSPAHPAETIQYRTLDRKLAS